MNTSVPMVMALSAGNMASNNGGVGATTFGDHTIIETQNGAVINWNYFGTSDTQSVTFNQYDVLGGSLSSSSAVLNQISGSATRFRGDLFGNGRVFIVNPAGIFFGSGTSTVNVAQLVVSGLNITNFDAVATTGALPTFVGGAGAIDIHGDIHADSIIIAGKKILNAGSLVADGGFVVLPPAKTYISLRMAVIF